MSLILRFLDRDTNVLIADTPAVKATVNIGLNKSGEFSADVPINTEALTQVDKGNIVQVLHDGELLIEGTLQTFDRAFEDKGIISIKGRDKIDDLYKAPAVSTAYFEDVPVLTVLSYLLHQAGWVLGDISTFPDLTETTTIDLRSQKKLIEQVSEVVKGVPRMAYRYSGDLSDGTPSLDVGYFGEDSFIQFVSAPADSRTINDSQGVGFIESMKIETELTDKVIRLELYGGELQDEVGVTRSIDLTDAINQDPTIRFHDTYPVREVWVPHQSIMYRRSSGLPGAGFLCWPEPAVDSLKYGDANPTGTVHQTNLLFQLLPIPGLLTEIALQYNADAGSPVGETFYQIQETNPGTGFGIGPVLASGTFTHVPNALNRIVISTPVEVEWDKYYIFQIGFSLDQADNVGAVIPMYDSDDFTASVAMWTYNRTSAILTYSNKTPRIFVLTVPHELEDGEGITDRWTQYAPPRTGANSGVPGIKKAGYAMWRRGCAFMDDHTGDNVRFSMDALGREIVPKIGQNIYVHGNVERAFTDPFTRSEVTYRENVQENLRVDGVSISMDSDQISYSYTLLKGNGVSSEDAFVSLYDETEKPAPRPGEVYTHIYVPELAFINVSIGVGQQGDALMADGRKGRIVEFVLPSPPANKREVYMCGLPLFTTSSVDMVVEVIDLPAYPSSSLVIRIAPRFRGWSAEDSADMTARIVWN